MKDAVRITIAVILLLVVEYLGMVYDVWPKAPQRGSYFSWWFCGGR